MKKVPMSAAEIREMFERDGVVLREGHFPYTGGKHGSVYINKDILLSDPLRAQALADELGRRILARDLDLDVEVVVGPAMSGIKMSHLVASFLSEFFRTQDWIGDGTRRVLSVYAEKDGPERFALRRGFDDVVKDRKVLVAEDIVTEANTARRVTDAVMAAGGTVIGIVALWNRGPWREIVLSMPGTRREINIPIVALVEERLEAWGPDECPLCANKVPFSTVGHAASFLQKKAPA